MFTCKGNPASGAYPIPCGMTVRAVVTPATRSPTRQPVSYWASHPITGRCDSQKAPLDAWRHLARQDLLACRHRGTDFSSC